MNNGSPSFHVLRNITAKLFPVLVQAIFCLGMVTAVQAATYDVNSPADTPLGSSAPCDGVGICTLRAAIQAANASPKTADTINVPAGTYTLSLTGINEDLAATGDLDITDNLTISGADRDTTIIDGNASDRVFQIMGGASVTLSNLTIQNGNVDADVNQTSDGLSGGGGIYNSGILKVDNCTIQQNTVINGADRGAGGGGVQTTGVAGTGPNTVRTTILSSTVTANSAPLGGGIRNFFGQTNIDLTEVDNNTASLSGGGVQNADGGMSITRSTIRNNTAQQTGGGVDNLAALDIGQSAIYNNQSVGIKTGGVVTTGGAGGGIYNGAAGALNLFNTTISGNNAVKAGGGIYNHKEVTATNSTIYDNSVINASGVPVANGTEVFACGTGTTENPTTCNTDIKDANGNLLIHTNFINSIVGNSTTTDNCNGDVAELVISEGHNIETGNTCGFNKATDQSNVSPAGLFSAGIGYYGGDLGSLWTFPISISSPAYNAGDNILCTGTDERSRLRDDGQCDIGAYEANAGTQATNVLDLALDITYGVANPLNGSVQTTITFAVANKGPLQGTNVDLIGSIPVSSTLYITNLDPRCSKTVTGFQCSGLTVDAYNSLSIFAAVLATKAIKFTVSGNVESKDQAENYNPDNSKSVIIDIPTVAGSSAAGNNFAGTAGGGGALDSMSLLVLFPTLVYRLRRRKHPG